MKKDVQKEPKLKKGSFSNNKKTDKSLKDSIKSGIAYGFNDGTTNSYISPYALALGANNNHIAMLTSIPNLLAPLSELGAMKAMHKFHSRKKIIIFSALLQTLMIIPMMIIPFFLLDKGPLVLVFFFSAYAIFGTFFVPAYDSWMGDLVPENIRGRYFGNRSKIIGFVSLTVMLISGYFLDLFDKGVFVGFFVLFIIGIIGRLMSLYYTAKMHEPEFTLKKKFQFSFFEFVKRMPFNNFGRFTIYIALMYFAVYVASPFFTVYMLKDLHLSYLKYTILTIGSGLATLIGLPLWGKFSDKYGNIRSLKITGFLVPIAPLLFLFSPNYYYLLFVQIFSGLAWSGFNLSAANFLFDSTTKQRRPACDAYSAVIFGLTIFLGASLGGYLATNLTISFMNKMLFIFLMSFILRLIMSLVMLPFVKEVREVNKRPLMEIIGFGHKGLLHKR